MVRLVGAANNVQVAASLSIADVDPASAASDQADWEGAAGGSFTLRYECADFAVNAPEAAEVTVNVPGGGVVGSVWNPAGGTGVQTRTLHFDDDPLSASLGAALRAGTLELVLRIQRTSGVNPYNLNSRGTVSTPPVLQTHHWARGYLRSNAKLSAHSLSNASIGGAEPASLASPDPVHTRITTDQFYRAGAVELELLSAAGAVEREQTLAAAVGPDFDYSWTGQTGTNRRVGTGMALASEQKGLRVKLPVLDFGGDNEYAWAAPGGGGTVAEDQSGNNRNGTPMGGLTIGGAGDPWGGTAATEFDGLDDRISSSYACFANGTTRTWTGWARPDAATRKCVFAGSASTNLVDFSIHSSSAATNANDVEFAPDWGVNRTNWTDAIPGVGQWFHWALVFNESTNNISLYVNGALVSSASNAGQYSSPGDFQLGRSVPGYGIEFDGRMCGVAVFESGLPASRIAAHAAASSAAAYSAGVLSDGPSLFWPLGGQASEWTRDSETQITRANRIAADPRLTVTPLAQKVSPRAGDGTNDTGPYVISADQLFSWGRVRNARSEGLSGLTLSQELKRGAATAASDTDEVTGADGWAPAAGADFTPAILAPAGSRDHLVSVTAPADLAGLGSGAQVLGFASAYTANRALALHLDDEVPIGEAVTFRLQLLDTDGSRLDLDAAPSSRIYKLDSAGVETQEQALGAMARQGATNSWSRPWTPSAAGTYLLEVRARKDGGGVMGAYRVTVRPRFDPIALTGDVEVLVSRM